MEDTYIQSSFIAGILQDNEERLVAKIKEDIKEPSEYLKFILFPFLFNMKSNTHLLRARRALTPMSTQS